jgi:LPXTG-motif cell wall-anchored protein
MAYKKISYALGRGQRRRRGMFGFGDSAGSAGTSVWDAATTGIASGATTGAVTAGTATPSIWDKIGGALNIALTQPPTMATMPIVPQTGMSTTTMVALAGGAVLIAALLLKKR